MDALGPLRIDRKERDLGLAVGQRAAGERCRTVFLELGFDTELRSEGPCQIDGDSGRPFAGGLAVGQDRIAHVEGDAKAPARREFARQ